MVISAKTEVVEKTINETGVAVRTGLFTVRQKMAYEPVGGKRRAPHLQKAHQAPLCKFSMLFASFKVGPTFGISTFTIATALILNMIG